MLSPRNSPHSTTKFPGEYNDDSSYPIDRLHCNYPSSPLQKNKLCYASSMTAGGRITGHITLKRDFGFIAPGNAEGRDYFVPPGSTGGAMNGDLVEARIDRQRGDTVAVVVKVLERASTLVVGSIDRRGNALFLICEQATDPMRIDEADARARRTALRPGLKAVAKITHYSTGAGPAVVSVSEILGEAGDPVVEARASKMSHQVPHSFPKSVLAEAAQLPDSIPASEIRRRTDLRDREIFTIDPEDARDFDDAISIENRDDGGWSVGVHIADVSYFVREGTALDEEAFQRGTSTYLPGEVIPMLPDRISNNLCSLVEGEDRLCSSVFIEFDRGLHPRDYSHCRSVIRSKRRFTYPEVDDILDSGEGAFFRELRQFKQIAMVLSAIRMERGAIDFNLPEDKPVLDADGKVTGIRRIERTWSHRLIEELMILTNEFAARRIEKRGIFRVHDTPSPEKLRGLGNFLAVFGFQMRGRSLQEVMRCFDGKPSQAIVERMILRTMQEAKYSHKNTGHYGLASGAYSHFTSPIRRYPDLIAHRIIHGEKLSRSIELIAANSSRRERAAMEAERDAIDIKFLEYASGMQGEEVKGAIDSVTRDGVYVSLDIGPRGYLHVSELGREDFKYSRDEASLVGRGTGRRFRIGDPIAAIIGAVNIGERRLWLSMSGEKHAHALRERGRQSEPPRDKPHNKRMKGRKKGRSAGRGRGKRR